MPGIARSEDVDALAARVAEEFVAVREEIENLPTAALDTVGLANAVFIENGGTIPPGTPAFTIVIELEA